MYEPVWDLKLTTCCRNEHKRKNAFILVQFSNTEPDWQRGIGKKKNCDEFNWQRKFKFKIFCVDYVSHIF